ncbi:MAG: exonuclease SbcCD subunit D [Actinomycetales bacterium]|nr:exonuclease SbcCD subunit D [Actinomycetales bacterium]
MRFLHTADWQLGMTRHFLDADAQPRYTGARLDAIGRIGELAVRHGCAFVLVCGDVFESNAISPRVVRRALEAMGAAGVPLYLLPGNHDPLDASSIYTSAAFRDACPDTVRVLDGSGPVAVGEGVELVAAPWSSKRPTTDLVAEAIADLPADGTLRVVAGHGMVDALSPDPTDPALVGLPVVEAALRSGRIHYLALGDRHSVTSVGDSGRIWYPGTPEVTDYDETAPGQVLVVDLDRDGGGSVGIGVRAHRVGTWSFTDLRLTVDGPDDVTALDDALSALPAKDRTVVRLALTGTLSLRDKAGLDAVLERHEQVFAAVRLWRRHTELAVYVDGEELGDLGVSGFAEAAAAELADRARATGEDAERARDALSLLYRLAGGAR